MDNCDQRECAENCPCFHHTFFKQDRKPCISCYHKPVSPDRPDRRIPNVLSWLLWSYFWKCNDQQRAEFIERYGYAPAKPAYLAVAYPIAGRFSD